MFYFHSYLGKTPSLTSIFFKWVGSTTNYNPFKNSHGQTHPGNITSAWWKTVARNGTDLKHHSSKPILMAWRRLGIPKISGVWRLGDTLDGRKFCTSWYAKYRCKYPIIFTVLYMPGGCFGISSINSMICLNSLRINRNFTLKFHQLGLLKFRLVIFWEGKFGGTKV